MVRDLPEGTSSETHRAPNVHGIPEYVERETLNPVIHKDTKVISQEGSGNTQLPRRGDDEELAESEEHSGDDRSVFSREDGLLGLVLQSTLVPVIIQTQDDLQSPGTRTNGLAAYQKRKS